MLFAIVVTAFEGTLREYVALLVEGSSPVTVSMIEYEPGWAFDKACIVIVPEKGGSPDGLLRDTIMPCDASWLLFATERVLPHVLPLARLTVYPVYVLVPGFATPEYEASVMLEVP